MFFKTLLNISSFFRCYACILSNDWLYKKKWFIGGEQEGDLNQHILYATI